MAGRNHESNQASVAVEGVVVEHPADSAPTTAPAQAERRPETVQSTATRVNSPRIHYPQQAESPLFAQPARRTPQPTTGLPTLPPQAAAPRVALAQPQEAAYRAPVTIAVAERPLAQPELMSHEPRATMRKRKLGVVSALLALAGVASGAAWGFVQSSDSNRPKSSPRAEGALIPGLATPNSEATIDTSTPTITDDPNQIFGAPVEAPSATSKSKPSTVAPKLVVPKPTTTTPNSHSTPATPTPEVTTSTAPSATSTSPETTTPEQTPSIGVEPDKSSLRLLSKFANNERAGQLKDQYDGVDAFLHAAEKGKLDFLNSAAMSAYQANVLAVYANQDVLNQLGYPEWLDETKLRDMRASGENPASALDSHTRNVLQHAKRLFPIVGDEISKLAYLNNDYSAGLTDQLNAQADVSEPTHDSVQIVGDVKEVNGIAVAPIASTYLDKDYQTVNVIDWEALVPIDRTGSFIGVVVLEQVLDQSDSKTQQPPTNESSPTTSDPTSPDPSPENTALTGDNSGKKLHGHGNKNRD